MATTKLTIYGVGANAEKNDLGQDVGIFVGKIIDPDTKEASISEYALKVAYVDETTSKEIDVSYVLTFHSFRFKKQMYQPNEIEADFEIDAGSSEAGDVGEYEQIDKDKLNELFVNKKVSLENIIDENNIQTICSGYYVYQVIPRYMQDRMFATMKIYSPDKVMTMETYCRTFVGKTLGSEILGKIVDDKPTGEMANYTLPYNPQKYIDYDYSSLKNIIAKEKAKEKDNEVMKVSQEHIFPYLVQYNESFYDFLKRTTNRWGEFLFYEDDQLHFGYETEDIYLKKDGYLTTVSQYDTITFQDLTSDLITQSNVGTYVGEAPYDSNVLKSVVTQNKYDSIKNTIANAGSIDDGADVYWMKMVGKVLTNGKSMFNFLVDTVVDDTMGYFQAMARVDHNNGRINDAYFSSNLKSSQQNHFGTNKDNVATYNQFSEASPMVNADTYSKILQGELKAVKNVINIDFDTTYPNLKLGQLIQVKGKEYIVVEVEGYQVTRQEIEDAKYIVSYIDPDLRYRVMAIAKDGDVFYPSMVSTGHVRSSGPQIGVVVDVDDPVRVNRVRVKFPWQLDSMIAEHDKNETDDKKKIKSYEGMLAEHVKDISKSDATPWLLCASPNGPKGGGVHGRHYAAEKVLVDFAYGNVERPYVVGAVSKDIPTSLKTSAAVLQASNYEMIKVHEGTGTGAEIFISSLTPGGKILNGFKPTLFSSLFGASDGGALNTEKSKLLEGGVEMTDRYGIWTIKGSTNDRQVAISSPWGDVKISAFTGITINAPNGDIKIQGKNVSIEAGNNLTLTSGKNIKNQLLPSLGNGAGMWWADLGLQVASAITTKLTSMVLSVFDLSILRNVVEVFLRPDEGLLTVKSNRYLKLESGKGKAGYPDVAYANRDKMVDAAKKARLSSTNTVFFETNLLPDILTLIGKIVPFIQRGVLNYVNAYNKAYRLRNALDQKCRILRNVSDLKADPIDNYENMISGLWNVDIQQDYTDMTANDITFSEAVAVENVTVVFINGRAINDQVQINQIVQKRTDRRNTMLTAANELRKAIYDTKKAAAFVKQLSEAQAGEVLQIKSYGFMKNTKNNILAAMNKDQNKKLLEITDNDKLLSHKMNNVPVQFIQIQSRRMALALMDALGFDDSTRTRPQNGPLPPKPVSDEDFTSACWNNYVSSITKVPNFGTDDNLFVKKNVAMLNSAIQNTAGFALSMKEWNSWSDNKNGDILFSSGKGTFKLGGHIERMPASYSSGLLNEEELSEANQNYFAQIRQALIGI